MRKVGTFGLAWLTLMMAVLVVTPGAHAQASRGSRGGDIVLPQVLVGPGSQIGVSIRDVEREDVSKLKLSAEAGVVIQNVRTGSPAETAGLREGDVVVEFDGERVRSAQQLTRLVRETPPGRRVRAAVIRDGQRREVEVTPAASDRQSLSVGPGDLRGSIERILPFTIRRGGMLGVTTQEMTPALADYFGVKTGILVTNVVRDSPAERAGVKVGDVITELAGSSVNASRDLDRAVQTRQGEVALTVVRDKKALTLKVMLEDRFPQRRSRIRAFSGI